MSRKRDLEGLLRLLSNARLRVWASLVLEFVLLVLGTAAFLASGIYGAWALGWAPQVGVVAALLPAVLWCWKSFDFVLLRSSWSNRAFVLEFERAHRLERGELLSPLEIARRQEAGEWAGAPSLVDRALSEVSRMVAEMRRRPFQRHRWRVVGGFALAGLLVALCSGLDAPGFLSAQSSLSGPRASLDARLWVGRDVVARGETANVFVRRLVPGDAPLILLLAPAGSEEGESVWDSRLVEELAGEGQVRDRPLFFTRIGPMSGSVRLKVSSGSFVSDVYKVKVASRPVIGRFLVEVDPPPYLEMDKQRVERTDGNLRVPRGSRVRIELGVDQPLASARFFMGKERKIQVLRPLPPSEQWPRGGFFGELEVTEDLDYEIQVTSIDGLANRPVRYHLAAVADEPPVVRILKPGRDLTMGEEQQVHLRLLARDDHRIDRMALFYRIDDDEEQSFELPAERSSTLKFDYLWNLAGLGLSFEQEVQYYVSVWDNDVLQGPKRGVSATYRLRYPSFLELFEESREEQSEQIEDVSDILEKQRRVVEQLERLAEDADPGDSLDWKESEALTDLLQQQEKLKERAQEIAKQLRQKAEQLEKEATESAEVVEKMQEISKLFDELADEQMEELLEKIRQTMEELKLTPEELAELQDGMTNEQLLRGLDRTLELLRRLEAERKLEAVSKLAEHLAERELELGRRSEELQRKEEGDSEKRDPREKGDSSKGQTDSGETPEKPASESDENAEKEASKSAEDKLREAEELAAKQQRLAEDLEELESELADLQDEEALERLKEELEKLEQELGDPSEEARRADDRLRKQKFDEAAKIQIPLGKRLQGLAGSLGRMAMQMRGMDKAEILALVEELVQELSSELRWLDRLRRRSLKVADVTHFSMLSGAQKQTIGEVAKGGELVHRTASLLLERIVDLGKMTPQLSSLVATEMEAAEKALKQAEGSIENLSMGAAATRFLEARVRLHEAAMALLSLNDAMNQGMPSAGQSLRESLENLAEEQRRLAESLRRGGSQEGMVPMPMPRSMEQMAKEQGRIRRQLQKLQKEFEALQGGMGSLEGLDDEMRELERHLSEGALKPEIAERQEKILDKLLEAERSLRERKLSPERQSKTAKEQAPFQARSPEKPKELWERQLEGLLEDQESELSPEERSILEQFYLRLAQEEP